MEHASVHPTLRTSLAAVRGLVVARRAGALPRPPRGTHGMVAPTRAALAVGAALLLLSPAIEARAQAVPRARAEAAATAFLDADVAWMLPLLEAEAGDRRRREAQAAASHRALTAYTDADASAQRVARLRGGAAAALDALRRSSPTVAVPPAARYDAACSVALTESGAALAVTAAFAVRDVAAAEEFYRAHGWRVLGGSNTGYVLTSPDGELRAGLASTLAQFRRIAEDVERRGLRGYDHVAACTGIPDRTALLITAANPLRTETRAAEATVGTPEQLPGALRAAGIGAPQWRAVFDALWQAEMDRLLPGTPSPAPASAEEASRRRANVRWLERHQAQVGPRLQATSTDA